ncbi:hypothetical protein ACG2F4_06105 [Halalkalibaculum sp. DA3122]|uniref:hypothetical protein n=1 Tax=unclassified Halalkalibaculum TaxID=2964617 RepID=UPI003754650B
MKKLKNIALVAISVLCLMLAGCSKSDDQKEFENQAYSPPQNFTAMSADGRPAGSNQTDPDDWRISPMYQGLVEVSTPPYPNPVPLNSSFRIDIDILGFETVPGMEIYAFEEAQNIFGPIAQYSQSELNPGVKVLVLNPANFSGTSSVQGTAGLNRLVIFDGRDNVITYGDVMVE